MEMMLGTIVHYTGYAIAYAFPVMLALAPVFIILEGLSLMRR